MSFIVIPASVRRLSSHCIQLSCGCHGIIRGRGVGEWGFFAVEPVVVKTEIAKD